MDDIIKYFLKNQYAIYFQHQSGGKFQKNYKLKNNNNRYKHVNIVLDDEFIKKLKTTSIGTLSDRIGNYNLTKYIKSIYPDVIFGYSTNFVEIKNEKYEYVM